MQQKKGKLIRKAEIATGLLLIFVALSYIASLLLDFTFVSPYASLQEDLLYLSEHTQSQQISSIAWGITALMTLLVTPFYVIIFRKKQPVLPYVNMLFLMGATAGFLLMAKVGLDLHKDIVQLVGEGIEQAEDQVKFSLLHQFRQEQLFRHIGSSFVGLFSLILSLSKFKIKRFPLISTMLLMISGPTLIFFNWYDPDHLARTGAMAGIIIGMTVLCVRLINKGLSD